MHKEYILSLSRDLPLEDIDFSIPENRNTKKSSTKRIEIAKVSTCLTNHKECTGTYTDFEERYLIVCNCSCHARIYESMGDE